METKEKKTRKPRTKNFTTEELNSVITEFVHKNSRIITLKKSELARFGNEHMDFKKTLHSYDFQRNKEINEKIEKFNENALMPMLLKETGKRKYVAFDIDVDYILGEFSKSKDRVKVVLNGFRNNTNRLKRMFTELEEEYNNLKLKYSEKKQKEMIMESKIAKLREKNKKLSEKIKVYRSYDFEREVRFATMVEALNEKRCFANVNELSRDRIVEIYANSLGKDKIEVNFDDTEPFERDYNFSIDGNKIKGIDPKGRYFEDNISNIDKYIGHDECFDDLNDYEQVQITDEDIAIGDELKFDLD